MASTGKEREGAGGPALLAQRERLQAAVAQQARAACAHFKQQVELAQARLAEVDEHLAALEVRLELARSLRGHPDGERAYFKAFFLHEVYGNFRIMLELERKTHAHNLALAEQPARLASEPFRQPDQHVDHLEARHRLLLAQGWYHWSFRAEAIDLALRAAMNQALVTPADEAARQAEAKALRAALANDRDALMLLASLAAGFLELQALLTWGLEQLPALGRADAALKREQLGRPEWTRLNGKVTLMLGLARRVAGQPVLARLFPPPPEHGPDLPPPPIAGPETSAEPVAPAPPARPGSAPLRRPTGPIQLPGLARPRPPR